MSDILNVSWFIKHQPKVIEDYVFDTESHKQIVEKIIETGVIPGNLLFSGPAGMGKSSLAALIIKNTIKSQVDYKHIKDRSVAAIDTLASWLNGRPVKSKKKVVLFEEMDKISGTASSTLKDGLLEKYQTNVAFIATSNFANKMDPALLSRFTHLPFTGTNVAGVTKRCEQILEIENINFDKDLLYEYIQKNYKMGLRNLITQLQTNSISGSLDFTTLTVESGSIETILVNETLTIFRYLLEGGSTSTDKRTMLLNPMNSAIANQYSKIIETIQFTKDLNYESILEEIDQKCNFLPVKMVISNYIETIQYKKLPHLHFIAFIYESMKVLFEINS